MPMGSISEYGDAFFARVMGEVEEKSGGGLLIL